MEAGTLTNLGHVNAVTSAILYFGFGTLPTVLGIGGALVSIVWNFRRAREIEASHLPNAELVPGKTVVFGKVEYAKDAEYAVRVELTQEGSESEGSGGWSHAWTEVGRVVRTTAFFLRHASGRRIRIEPDTEVQLLDALDGIVEINATKRKRIVQLSPDEEVLAEGILSTTIEPEASAISSQQNYRASAQGFVLRPIPGKPMLLASERLGTRYQRRGWAWVKVLGLAAFLGGIAHLSVLRSYYHLLLWGVPTQGIVQATPQWETSSDSGTTTHWGVDIRPRDNPEGVFRAEITAQEQRALTLGQTLTVRFVPHDPSASVLGPAPTANVGSVLFFATELLIGIFVSMYLLGKARAWYDNPRVRDAGPGRLAENIYRVNSEPK